MLEKKWDLRGRRKSSKAWNGIHTASMLGGSKEDLEALQRPRHLEGG